MKKFILLSFVTLLTAIGAFSQSATTLRNRCPNTSIYSVVQITGVGDINVQPCAGKTTTFTQNVVLPAGTVISGGSFGNGTAASPSIKFTNSPTTGFYRSAADVLGISTAGALNTSFSAATNLFTSPIQTFTSSTSDNHNTAIFTINNAAANAEFSASITPSSSAGLVTIGDCVTTRTTCLSMTQSTGIVRLGNTDTLNGLSVSGTQTTLGMGVGFGAQTNISTDDATKTVAISASGAADKIFDLSKVLNYSLQRTITAGGTTGNQTINKPNGSVNIAAGATGVVITNNTVTTSSTIIAVANSNDTTCVVKNATPFASTIQITMTAACTAETRVAFWVFN